MIETNPWLFQKKMLLPHGEISVEINFSNPGSAALFIQEEGSDAPFGEQLEVDSIQLDDLIKTLIEARQYMSKPEGIDPDFDDPLKRAQQRFNARLFGYFWLPCPLCAREFGGHEWREINGLSGTIYGHRGDDPSTGKGICPVCTALGRGERYIPLKENHNA